MPDLPTFDLPQGFYIDLGRTTVNPHWRVYHDADDCGTDVFESAYGVDLDTVLAAVRDHKCPTIDPVQALNWAIFAVNNHTDPDASTEEDVAELEAKAPEILATLTRLREYAVAIGEDLPDWVTEAQEAHEAKKDVAQLRPLSDFAIHIGLLPYEQAYGPDGRAAGLWVDGELLFGKDHVEEPVTEVPGLYVNGTWTEWGEVSEDDPTTHLVYRFEDSPSWTDFGAVVGGLWHYIKRHQGWGRLTDAWTISLANDYAEQVATVTVTDGDAVVVPRDWRTR